MNALSPINFFVLLTVKSNQKDQKMNNSIGSVAYHLELRKSTIKHFCNDFNTILKDYIIFKVNDSSSLYGSYATTPLEQEFVDYLVHHASFLRSYQEDYYSDKDPEIIANTIDRKVEDIKPYLQRNYPKFFKNGEVDLSVRYLFRYVSSYKIDFDLSTDYSFLKM